MKDIIPTVLYATEDQKLAEAVAKEMEVKDPDDDHGQERIIANTRRNDGTGINSDDRRGGEDNNTVSDDVSGL